MRTNFYITGLWIFFTCAANVAAQVIPYIPPGRQTIFEELQSAASGKGTVTIDQPVAIRNMVGTRLFGDIETTSDGKSYIKFQGFRVQVFSGNDQRTSKEEALKREREIKEIVPDIATYVTFVAPFWRLRVGDFGSQEEAYFIQRQLMQSFQKYGKEMYIVREDIKLPVHDTF
jgi:hypothetical protein